VNSPDSSSILLYLVGAGLLLLVGLGVVLYRMRKEKEAEPFSRTSAPDIGTPPPSEAEAPAHPPQESRKEREASPIAETRGACEGFVETPDITRDSFAEFANRRILVVEDNPVNRRLIETLLAGSRIDLETAVDGVEALEMLREASSPFELVLMDVNMPRMDGLECTRQIRRDPQLQKLCVLALTASTTPEEVEAIAESGMDGYLEKPIVLGQLYTAFAHCLNAQEKEEESDPRKTMALDERVGLQFTNGDRQLYRTILEDFLRRYEQAPEEFARMVEEKDLPGLKTLLVDLEGLSGTMGARELYETVRRAKEMLEQAPVVMLREYVAPFREAFERLREVIAKRLESW